MIKWVARLAVVGLLALSLVAVSSALAAANTVPASTAGDMVVQSPITADELKPAYCPQALTAIITGSGTINGTTASELIIGSAGADTISGKGGSDCMLGGGGNDTLKGGGGSDVCDGGPGIDTAISCATTLNIP